MESVSSLADYTNPQCIHLCTSKNYVNLLYQTNFDNALLTNDGVKNKKKFTSLMYLPTGLFYYLGLLAISLLIFLMNMRYNSGA
jgi:hypothetical protein